MPSDLKKSLNRPFQKRMGKLWKSDAHEVTMDFFPANLRIFVNKSLFQPENSTILNFSLKRYATLNIAASLSINWLDTAYRLAFSLRQVALAQLYKYHHQSGNAASGKLVQKQHKSIWIWISNH